MLRSIDLVRCINQWFNIIIFKTRLYLEFPWHISVTIATEVHLLHKHSNSANVLQIKRQAAKEKTMSLFIPLSGINQKIGQYTKHIPYVNNANMRLNTQETNLAGQIWKKNAVAARSSIYMSDTCSPAFFMQTLSCKVPICSSGGISHAHSHTYIKEQIGVQCPQTRSTSEQQEPQKMRSTVS